MIHWIRGWMMAVALMIVAIFTAFMRGAAEGRRKSKEKANEATRDALGSGRQAVRDGRGRTPVDRMRDNEDRW
jgi:hypothetical protein